jgi:hypothetical protein
MNRIRSTVFTVAFAAALPWMMGAAHAAPAAASSADAPLFVGQQAGPRTRAEVRDELMRAKATNTMSLNGEAGDTPEVLAARQTFNELQREVAEQNQAQMADWRKHPRRAPAAWPTSP